MAHEYRCSACEESRSPALRHITSSYENVPGAILEIDGLHWQHPVTGRHARCQFMVAVGPRAPMVTVFEETRERSTRNNQTSECKESLLKDWFVHRGRPRLGRMDPDGCYMSNEMLDLLHHDLGISTEVIPGEALWRLSITGVIMRLVKRTAHECLLQAVMAHSRLLKHGGYTPLQLLFGHEPAPIEGEAFDDEQPSRSVSVSMGETGKTAVSHEGVVASRSQVSRRTSTEPTYTRCSTLALWNSCLQLESPRSERGFFVHESAAIYRNSEQTQGCMVGSCDSSGSGNGSESRATRRGSWHSLDRGAGDDFCDVHLNTCDISANVKVCQLTETRETVKKSSNVHGHCSGFPFFERHTHVDLRSQHDGSEPRHFSGKIFVRTPTETPRTSSSGMGTGTMNCC